MARMGTGADVSDSSLARLAAEAAKSGIPWLERLRGSALERFEALGLPSTTREEWRQTNVSPIAATPFVRASAARGAVPKAEMSALPLADLGCPRIVLVNGLHDPELSEIAGLPCGIRVESLAAALDDGPEGGHCQAALAASIFHFREISVPELKRKLHALGIPVRLPSGPALAGAGGLR